MTSRDRRDLIWCGLMAVCVILGGNEARIGEHFGNIWLYVAGIVQIILSALSAMMKLWRIALDRKP